MQSLEAVLHLVWEAAEAAAKSIRFVSRERRPGRDGTTEPAVKDTRGSLEWGR